MTTKEQAVAVVEVSLRDRALTELKVVDAGIAALKQTYGHKKYDCTNTAEMAEAKADRLAIREVRYKVPKIAEDVTKQLNNLKSEIKSEAERIIDELMEIESISDNAIKTEEKRKEEEKAEKIRIAAEAQKVLDDKILEIGKLPLRCINRTSEEIKMLLDAITAKEIGGEFTGETRERAEAAKTQAVADITEMLDVALKLEESNRVAEAERKEREEQQAKEDLERANQDRILKEQQEKLRLEQEEFNRQQEVARKEREEQDRILREEREKQEAETRRQQEEKAAQERETARLATEKAEQERKEADRKRLAAEKTLKLQKAKCRDAVDALKTILDICFETEHGAESKLERIATVCEANL